MNKLIDLKSLLTNRWFRALAWALYMTTSYVVSMYLLVPIVLGLQAFGVEVNLEDNATTVSLMGLVYIFAIGLTLLGFRLMRLSWQQLPKLIGLHRLIKWRDLGHSLVGYLVYFGIAIVVMLVATKVPGFDSSQPQEVGISAGASNFGMVMAFVGLVIIAPLAEEIMFRGALYGYLRKIKINRWLAILAVSALFGLAHGQWNVGLDTFILSTVLCVLRDKTGSIWSGVVVHMIKNSLAFIILFTPLFSQYIS